LVGPWLERDYESGGTPGLPPGAGVGRAGGLGLWCRLHFRPMTDLTQIPADQEPIIGIDLGTTNSLAAYCDERGPRILEGPDGQRLLPSVVRYRDPSGEVEAVGREARTHAVEYPHNTIFSAKRLMGRSVADVGDGLGYLPYEVVEGEHNTARVKIAERLFSPQEISAVILSELRRWAEASLGRTVRKAVVTVPAYFDDAQRQATRDAGRIAGLEVVRIVNEPTAAALAYNLGFGLGDSELGKKTDGSVSLSTKLKPEVCAENQSPTPVSHPPMQTVAVFDLGGGTFDVSVLRLMQTPNGRVDQVLATSGDTHLGGDDVDRMIVELIQQEVREQFGEGINFPASTRQAFRNFAEATKIRLSQEDSARVEVDLGTDSEGQPRVYHRTLTRDEFEKMIGPWVEKTIQCCEQALRSAKCSTDDIGRVVMVGGSTRIPMVRRRVGGLFKTEPYTALNPDEVVALGAAVQGSILAGITRDMLLLDVIPLSLGIETMGGAVSKLVMANSTIPAQATEMFSTYADGQTSIKVHVLQGERELVSDCRSLGEFELKGIPPMPAGLPKVELTFLVDANGVLNVQAVEKRSEKRASIQIVPNHGLTREEVDRMEAESYEHAAEDMMAHRLIDLRNQARLDMRAIEKQLAKVGDGLDAGYRSEVETNVAEVKALADASDTDADRFHEALDAMDKSTVRLAELSIAKTLREEQDTPAS
jgi:molecular chaperone DnaK